jgi:hypothetical protein
MPSEIDTLLERHSAALLELPNVVSVGIGERDGRPVIVVGVTEQVPSNELAPDERIPERIDGYEVDVLVLGAPEIEV